MNEKAEGITLGGLRYGETSKIIRVFTRQHGKISFMVKGAIRKNNKYGATIEPLSVGEYSYIRKNNGLHLLTDAELLKYFSQSISDFNHFALSLAIIEIVNATQAENDPNEYLFDIMLHFLTQFNDAAGTRDCFDYFIYFLLDYAGLLGYMIDLGNYNPLAEFNYLTFEDGLISLGGFAGKSFFKLPTSLIEKMQNASDELTVYSDYEKKTARKFFEAYFSFHFEKKIIINSLDFLM